MIKVLLADDEPVILHSVEVSIPWEKMGLALCGAYGDGMSAYHAFLDESPDIVLTDIRMPALSGLELIRRTRAFSPDTVFIILSGYADFDYARTAMEYGVRYYLLKPCSQERIMDAMKTAMKDVEGIRQTRQAQSAYAGMLAQGNSVPESPDPDVTTSEGRARIHALVRSLPGAEQAKIYAFGILCRVQGITPEDAGNLPPFGNKLAGMKTREEVADFLMNCLTSVYEKDGHASGTRRFVARILRWVEEDYADPELSLKTIAEQKLFMNTDYVSREFLRETGEKFSQALIRTRMEHAKELMRERAWDAKIYEIAEQVGCSNAQYFAQAFKKYTGVTPTGYMEAQRTGGGIKSC